jgi:NADH:ubiquinone oxidoreductase subunit K
VYGQLLIRSILVLLFSFEVPLKNIKKNLQEKEKKQQQRRGFVCVFVFAVVLCDYLCVQAQVFSTI